MARERKGAFLGGDERVNQNRNRIESNRIECGRQKVMTSSAIRPPSKLKELVLFLIISSSV